MRTRDPLVEGPYAVDTHVVPERILLIDDDVTLCRLVSQYLTGEGFQTDTAQSGEQGLKQALAGKHALIVLGEGEEGFIRAARNLAAHKVLRLAGLNVYDVLNYEELLITAKAARALDARLGGGGDA